MYLIETERFIWKQKDPEELQIAPFQVVTHGRFEKIKQILVKLKLIFEKNNETMRFSDV